MVANQATNASALSQNVAPKRHLREGLSNCPWTKICEPWQGCHPPQATFVSPSVPCSSTVWARKWGKNAAQRTCKHQKLKHWQDLTCNMAQKMWHVNWLVAKMTFFANLSFYSRLRAINCATWLSAFLFPGSGSFPKAQWSETDWSDVWIS